MDLEATVQVLDAAIAAVELPRLMRSRIRRQALGDRQAQEELANKIECELWRDVRNIQRGESPLDRSYARPARETAHGREWIETDKIFLSILHTGIFQTYRVTVSSFWTCPGGASGYDEGEYLMVDGCASTHRRWNWLGAGDPGHRAAFGGGRLDYRLWLPVQEAS